MPEHDDGPRNSEGVPTHGTAVTIYINTKPYSWSEKKVSFEQVLALAFPGTAYDPEGTTVEYSRGHGPDKSLRPGGDVEVKDGMVFVAEPANRS